MEREKILELAVALAKRHSSIAAGEWVMRFHGVLTFGTEFVDCEGREAQYVNCGDTYDQTVILEGSEFSVGSWGDWLEAAENEYNDDNDTIGCAYCSHKTPLCEKAQREPKGAQHSWRETICENCGNYVDGSGKPSTVAQDD